MCSEPNALAESDENQLSSTETTQPLCCMVATSASFLAEISVRSPRKLVNFIILNNFRIKISQKNVLFILENRSDGSETMQRCHEDEPLP